MTQPPLKIVSTKSAPGYHKQGPAAGAKGIFSPVNRSGTPTSSVQADASITSGGDGGSGTLDQRVFQLEYHVSELRISVAEIKTRLETELPHLATKADIQKLSNRYIWGVVVIVLTVLLSIFGKTILQQLDFSKPQASTTPAVSESQDKSAT